MAVGTEAQRRSALMRRADIYIINRENVQWLIDESGIPFDFDNLMSLCQSCHTKIHHDLGDR